MKSYAECEIPGCLNPPPYVKGLCRLHYSQKRGYRLGIEKYQHMKGENNPRWKGGISYYPNHATMKKIRLLKLEEKNYICEYCGGPATKIHHIDQNRSNHKPENLKAICNLCHAKIHLTGKSHKTSPYIKLYGKTMVEISKLLQLEVYKVSLLHSANQLKNLLP